MPHTFTENGAGIYQNDGFPQVTIIVINELPLTQVNIPLILFAGNEAKFREAVLHLLADNNVEYVSYALLIRPQQTQELAEMTNRYEENMKIIARDMGADMIKYMEPEVLRAALVPKQLVASLSMEDIERLRQLKLLTTEETVWRDLHTLDSAKERIELLEQIPRTEQSLVFNLSKLDQLVNGLDKTEQAAFITWFLDRIAEDDEG